MLDSFRLRFSAFGQLNSSVASLAKLTWGHTWSAAHMTNFLGTHPVVPEAYVLLQRDDFRRENPWMQRLDRCVAQVQWRSVDPPVE